MGFDEAMAPVFMIMAVLGTLLVFSVFGYQIYLKFIVIPRLESQLEKAGETARKDIQKSLDEARAKT
ncbi:MAG: hypothetical protein HYV90_05980 [Candidatus Woesebacteria bacterium]|nr:MAG: hypothetical protein HYV90_05980 [Candidatus Woesebacteria bacterium]